MARNRHGTQVRNKDTPEIGTPVLQRATLQFLLNLYQNRTNFGQKTENYGNGNFSNSLFPKDGVGMRFSVISNHEIFGNFPGFSIPWNFFGIFARLFEKKSSDFFPTWLRFRGIGNSTKYELIDISWYLSPEDSSISCAIGPRRLISANHSGVFPNLFGIPGVFWESERYSVHYIEF